MFRVLLIFLAVAAIAWAIMTLSKPKPRRLDDRRSATRRDNQATKNPGSNNQEPQQVVQCAHCGVHIPTNEAVEVDGRSYCSTEHSLEGPSEP